MNTLPDLVRRRREQLGLSLNDVATQSGGLVSKTYLSAIERGDYHVPGDRILRGIALALDLPVERVAKAAGRTWTKLPPFTLPEKADRLNARERKLVIEMVEALLAAHDKP